MKGLERIIRSVKAFGRELSRGPEEIAVGPSARIGLALGGGFARGIAHVGILKVLEEENIPISFIAGTSVGALIGAAYCGGLSAAELEKVASRVRFRDFARWTLSRYGFATNRRMIGFLNSILTVKNFEDLSIPLAVTATDFATGEGVVFHSGPLVEPVRASCAYPGMFLPVNIRGRLLVDGMLAHAVPTQPLRDMGADRVVAVHLRGCWARRSGPRHIFDVIGQCFAIAQDLNTHVWKQAADLVVEPDVKAFEYDDFAHSSDLVRAGETVMRQALPEIRKWLSAQPQQNALDQKTAKRPSVAQPAAIPAE